ncbi:2-hydroxyacid dehydrogenase [Shimia sp.]|uniref:2-hydroxyacid dehydrogenase n=1 Tax=Shimia sp. TaxID=1954381 RepID=UPI003B8EA523
MADLMVLCSTTPEMQLRLSGAFDVVYEHDLPDVPTWLDEHGEDIRYILTDGHLGLPSEVLSRVPNLKAVSSYGVGYDAIDTGKTNARGIPVSHTPSVLDEEVATTALLLYLSVMRGFVTQANHAKAGRWETQGGLPLTRSADGRKIGILGLGRIGKALARKLAPFGAEISYCGRSMQDNDYQYFASLTEMARHVDVLICIAPGGASTHHIVNADVMAALGANGVLINVGRGSIVDEIALASALNSGTLGGAGLDVFENEPYIPKTLREMPNVVVTPHIGSATIETRRAMGALAVDNIVEHKASGKMHTPVPECIHLFN